MFEQFRAHFPQGSLISELIQIDHGKYIVRAMIQNEGLTLATGLAAADTVEQAEDKARTRALAVLGITLTPTPASPALSQKSQPASSTRSTQAKAHYSSTPNPPVPSVKIPEKQTLPSQPSPALANGTAQVEATETASNDASTEAEAEPEASEEQTQKAVELGSQDENRGEAAITDSSDIIARTNVELRRLKWTSEQGRKFLEETYGKRSRSLLSESELSEFLEYLEKQPAPAPDSDQ